MTRRIVGFLWEENLRHLRDRHPEVNPEELEDVLLQARRWLHVGRDRFGKDVWSVFWGKRVILFNELNGWIRIFSVQNR